MTTRVRAMYDFSGEPNTSELSIVADEILTLTRTDVGEGWWEGTNSKGQTGLFPEAYVELHKAAATTVVKAQAPTPVALPAPQNASSVSSTSHQQPTTAPPRYDQSNDDWSEPPDDWDDDWDEDNETYSEIGPPQSAANVAAATAARKQTQAVAVQQPRYTNSNAHSLPATPTDDTISMTSTSAPLKKSGIFGKAGDTYILGTTNVAVADADRVFVQQLEAGLFWKRIREPYTVCVASPKKETKFKGIKSFIAYQLTPSFNGIAVSRRYKHFDWLHERLTAKFCLIPVPPLPDKQISGRYEDQFVEHRRVQLQEFVDWVCRHPVLSVCEVWTHFLTCTDEKRWKTGKRAAERDVLVGATYCAAIFPPEKQLLQSQVDGPMENCTLFVHAMDGAVKSLQAISNEQIKRYQMQWKKDFQRVGESFSELARALEIDERRAITNVQLSSAVGQAAGVFISIGQMFGEQPKADWLPFGDRLHIYRGILLGFPDVMAVHRGAMQKRKECENLTAQQKMGNAQLQEVNRRTDIMSYAVLAEMNHFRQERDVHLRATMKNLISSQIDFYQEIIGKLQAAKKFFE